MKKLSCLSLLLMCLVLLSACHYEGGNQSSIPDSSASTQQSEDEKQKLLEEAVMDVYLYTFPLMLNDAVRSYLTNTEKAASGKAPVNTFGHHRNPLKKTAESLLRPSGDSLQSQAVLDLTKEPVVLQIPQTERSFLLVFFDRWGDMAYSISTPGTYLLYGPETEGEYAFYGAKDVYLTDDELICNAYVFCNTALNVSLEEARKWQDSLFLAPFSADKDTPAQGTYDPEKRFAPTKVLLQMDIESYFDRCLQLLHELPPHELPESVQNAMAYLGIKVGGDFDLQQYDFAERLYLQTLSLTVYDALEEWEADHGSEYSGWQWQKLSGTDDFKACVLDKLYNAYTPSLNVMATAVTQTDGKGKELVAGEYLITIPADTIPRGVFWSIGICDEKGNPILENGNPCCLFSYNMEPDAAGNYVIRLTTREAVLRSLVLEEGKFSLFLRLYGCPEAYLSRMQMPLVESLDDSAGEEDSWSAA